MVVGNGEMVWRESTWISSRKVDSECHAPSDQYSAGPLREPPDYRTIPVIESKWLCRVSAPPTAH